MKKWYVIGQVVLSSNVYTIFLSYTIFLYISTMVSRGFDSRSPPPPKKEPLTLRSSKVILIFVYTFL